MSSFFRKGKIFNLYKSGVSNKAYERILMPRRKRCRSLNFEKYMPAWISPIRHILQETGKYEFCAICAHIKIIIWYFESLKQCKCATPHLETQPWTCSGFMDSSNLLLNSQNYSIFYLCIKSPGKWKIQKNSSCCSFPHNFAWGWKGLNELCSFIPTCGLHAVQLWVWEICMTSKIWNITQLFWFAHIWHINNRFPGRGEPINEVFGQASPAGARLPKNLICWARLDPGNRFFGLNHHFRVEKKGSAHK